MLKNNPTKNKTKKRKKIMIFKQIKNIEIILKNKDLVEKSLIEE